MTTKPETAGAGLPPFYSDPQPLSSAAHGGWRLEYGDASFAAEAPYVPIVVGELASAARCYPIVFAADGAQPIAVLGLERRNLFVNEGRWDEQSYVPAYVRRYPFCFIATVDPAGFALAIDVASDRVMPDGDGGLPIFKDGKPSELTRQALDFCDAFQIEAGSTRAFAEALQAQNILIDRRADATLPDGRTLGVDGFQIVDAQKFAALGDDVVLDWHRKGWLALVQFHLASLERFQGLLARQTLLDRTDDVTPAPSNAADGETMPAHPLPDPILSEKV